MAAASSEAAARVARRATARPRAIATSARQVTADAIGLLRTEARLARIEVQEQIPGLVRGGIVAMIGASLLGLVPALLAVAAVLWLGASIGHAGAALVVALGAGLGGLLAARAGLRMLRRVSLVPAETLGRIEQELARLAEPLGPGPVEADAAAAQAVGGGAAEGSGGADGRHGRQ